MLEILSQFVEQILDEFVSHGPGIDEAGSVGRRQALLARVAATVLDIGTVFQGLIRYLLCPFIKMGVDAGKKPQEHAGQVPGGCWVSSLCVRPEAYKTAVKLDVIVKEH